MQRMEGNGSTRGAFDVSERRAARIAGIGYLAIFVLAIFANFVVRGTLVEPDDAAATVENISASTELFRAGLIAFLVVFALDIVIAWALYIVFRPVGRDLSLVAAWFRLVYTTFLGVALIFFFRVLELTGGEGFLTAFDPAQRAAHTMLALDAFDAAWMIGLVCFGIHLVLLGSLVLRSRGAPRALGYLLMAAGAAYMVDTMANALLPNYDDLETVFLAIVAIPSILAELAFAIWLITRGTKAPLAPRPVEATERAEVAVRA